MTSRRSLCRRVGPAALLGLLLLAAPAAAQQQQQQPDLDIRTIPSTPPPPAPPAPPAREEPPGPPPVPGPTFIGPTGETATGGRYGLSLGTAPNPPVGNAQTGWKDVPGWATFGFTYTWGSPQAP